jgi:hypothetical protein
MATGFPAATGDVLSYTLAATDQYQVLVLTTNASTKTVSIPTDATYNFPVGTAVTILNTGAGLLTINAVTSGTTTITSAGASSAAPTVGQYKAGVAIKTAANAWTVIGGVA